MSSIVNFNGKTIRVNGSLSMINGKWFVNGKEVDMNTLAEKQEQEQQVTITINLAEGSSRAKEHKTIMESRGASRAGLCSEERSMISPDYARNFICDFIIGKIQNNTVLTLF